MRRNQRRRQFFHQKYRSSHVRGRVPNVLSKGQIRREEESVEESDQASSLRTYQVSFDSSQRDSTGADRRFVRTIKCIRTHEDKNERKLLQDIYNLEAEHLLYEFGFSLQEVLSYTRATQKAIVKDIRECQFTLLRTSSSARSYIRAVLRLEYIWLSDGVRPDRLSRKYQPCTVTLV